MHATEEKKGKQRLIIRTSLFDNFALQWSHVPSTENVHQIHRVRHSERESNQIICANETKMRVDGAMRTAGYRAGQRAPAHIM